MSHAAAARGAPGATRLQASARRLRRRDRGSAHAPMGARSVRSCRETKSVASWGNAWLRCSCTALATTWACELRLASTRSARTRPEKRATVDACAARPHGAPCEARTRRTHPPAASTGARMWVKCER
eukprot:scaffold5520_cov102-Isochrysis_galbana.AAC.10